MIGWLFNYPVASLPSGLTVGTTYTMTAYSSDTSSPPLTASPVPRTFTVPELLPAADWTNSGVGTPNQIKIVSQTGACVDSGGEQRAGGLEGDNRSGGVPGLFADPYGSVLVADDEQDGSQQFVDIPVSGGIGGG